MERTEENFLNKKLEKNLRDSKKRSIFAPANQK